MVLNLENTWLKTSAAFKARIIGKLLGDGCITKQANRKPRLKFQHKEEDLGWTSYCQQQLHHEILLNSPTFKKIKDNRLISGFNTSYYVQSKTHPVITYLHKQWYVNGKKTIPFNILEKHFTDESLAWWYMDDGHLNIKNNIPIKIILSTESFSHTEINSLINLLYRKHQLSFSIDKQSRILLYDQYQVQYFLHIISPFLHCSMYRKIIAYSFYYSVNSARRTTIYLSKSIKLSKPTFQINKSLYYLSFLIKQFKENIFYPTYSGDIQSIQKENATNSYQIIIKKII